MNMRRQEHIFMRILLAISMRIGRLASSMLILKLREHLMRRQFSCRTLLEMILKLSSELRKIKTWLTERLSLIHSRKNFMMLYKRSEIWKRKTLMMPLSASSASWRRKPRVP